MSANTGIYILVTKDNQHRVVGDQGVPENLRWSYRRQSTDEMISARIVEIWGACDFTYKGLTAVKIAGSRLKAMKSCEYGIQYICVNKTWIEILEEGLRQAKEELAYLECTGTKEDFSTDSMERLERVASGAYLNEWLLHEEHRREKKTDMDVLHKLMKDPDFCLKVNDITFLGLTGEYYGFSAFHPNGRGSSLHQYRTFGDLRKGLISIKGRDWYQRLITRIEKEGCQV